MKCKIIGCPNNSETQLRTYDGDSQLDVVVDVCEAHYHEFLQKLSVGLASWEKLVDENVI